MNIPKRPAPRRDLSDAEFAELDELLVQTPTPLEPLDAVMLDGYLCGVLVQPQRLTPSDFLPFIFDFDGRPLPESDAPEYNTWLERTTALIARRYSALNRAMEEDGWFDPLILEVDESAPADDPACAETTENAPAASERPALDEDGKAYVEAVQSLSPISKALMPWVAGFQHACESFDGLYDSDNEAIQLAISRLYRHLPVTNEEEQALLDTLNREHPLATLDDAMEELVVTVADLCDLTRDARYKVETIERDGPKVGRNDPCPCGSGKKYKRCHGFD
jgi:uncharacterized protein